MRALLCLLLAFGLAQLSQAANYPCSGKKGAVARCDGELWVCNDGSISGTGPTNGHACSLPASRFTARSALALLA